MKNPVCDGVVTRMKAELKAGTLSHFEMAFYAGLVMFDLNMLQAIKYAEIFTPPV